MATLRRQLTGINSLGTLCVVVLTCGLAFAGASRELTQAQYDQLETYITVTAKPEFDADIAAGNDQPIADKMNQAFTPSFQVYKTAVTRRTILFEKSPANTNFIFEGNGYLTLTSQELTTFHDFFDGPTFTMDPSLPNVQAGLDQIFKLPGNATSNRNHIKQHSVRPVTRAEKLYVTQGQGTTADPGYLVWEGVLTQYDISYALRGVR
jgi:hypothetical protein